MANEGRSPSKPMFVDIVNWEDFLGDIIIEQLAVEFGELRDFDTTGGVDDRALIGMALPGAGGAVIGGTDTDPITVRQKTGDSWTVATGLDAYLDGVEALLAEIELHVENTFGILDDVWDDANDRLRVHDAVTKTAVDAVATTVGALQASNEANFADVEAFLADIELNTQNAADILADVWDDANDRLRVHDATALAGIVAAIQAQTAAQASGTTATAPISPLTLTTTAQVVVAANTNRKKAIIRNTSVLDDAYLGYTSGVTAANAPIVLGPGDTWVETDRTAVYALRASTILGASVVVTAQEVNA